MNTDNDVEDDRQPGRNLDARLFIISPSPPSGIENYNSLDLNNDDQAGRDL